MSHPLVEKVINSITKSGLMLYQPRNSKYKTKDYVGPTRKTGKVFAFRSKENMTNGKGIIFSSVEGLLKNDNLTHWTPNVFSYGRYKENSNRKIVEGHYERNLMQINCFCIDVDCGAQKMDLQELLELSRACDLEPSLVINTPKGYHLYLNLDNPSYISNANNYKSLKVAKRVSQHIRKAYSEVIPGVDIGCNHFGIFRYPSFDEILFWEEDKLYNFEELMEWSITREKTQSKGISGPSTPVLRIVSRYPQINSSWFKALINKKDISNNSAGYARNNTLFTLALACYGSGLPYSDCNDMLWTWNQGISAPLDDSEFARTLKSAYSGKYKGASKDYIDELLGNQNEDRRHDQRGFADNRTWYKYKKERKYRKYSHFDEWERDLLVWLNKTSQKAIHKARLSTIVEAINIPLSTLKEVLKRLKEKGMIWYETTRGRKGRTYLATKATLLNAVQMLKNKYASQWRNAVLALFNDKALASSFVTFATSPCTLIPEQVSFLVETIGLNTG